MHCISFPYDVLVNGHNNSVRVVLWLFSFSQIRRLRLKEVNLGQDTQLANGLARFKFRWAHSRAPGVSHHITSLARGSFVSLVEKNKEMVLEGINVVGGCRGAPSRRVLSAVTDKNKSTKTRSAWGEKTDQSLRG